MKPNFYIIKFKRNILTIFFLFFTISLIIFSNSNLLAIKSGINLWATSVVPSLFPFFVSTELLMHTNIINILGNILNKYMKPLFNVRGEGAFAFIMGIISGYPVGAKIATNFRKNNICSKEECERLLSFTNNSGPLFIIGTVGILMFGNSAIGLLLFITHILSCFSVGIIFRFWKKNSSSNNLNSNLKSQSKYVSFSNLGEVLSLSITNSISTLLLIGGFVVLFSSILSILKSSGILNILYTTMSINIIFTSFLLGFGGISVLLQVVSIVSKTDLSIKPYIYGKILQGIFASFYTYIFINVFPFLNFDL